MKPRTWTERKIEHGILTVSKTMSGYMPSATDLASQGMQSLASAISIRGGFAKWRTRLRLHEKQSETATGKRAERAAARILRTRGCDVKTFRCKHPYDLLVNGHRVDVKSARHSPRSGGYVFITRNKPPVTAGCDFFLLALLDSGERPFEWYVIPESFARVSTVTITRNGKYHGFKGRFDLIGA